MEQGDRPLLVAVAERPPRLAGIFLITARGRDQASKFVDGRPVANQTDYRVDIQKGTPFALDGTIRVRLGAAPLVTTAKSLRFQVPSAGLELPVDEPLAHAVFDLFGAGTEVTLNEGQARRALFAMARGMGWSEDDALEQCKEVWRVASSQYTTFGVDAMQALYDALPAGPVAA